MVVHGNGGILKYEFRLRPGARVSDIRLAYRGAQALSIGAGGGLLVHTASGDLKDSRPVSYQLVDGKRRSVESSFLLEGGSRAERFGFHVGSGYDPRRELIIDPGIVYSTFLGGSGFDGGRDIAIDEDGDAYVLGDTLFSDDFPTKPGAFQTRNAGSTDLFVAKLNRTGSDLEYSTYIGSSNGDYPGGIAVDRTGSAYVTGETFGPGFPTTSGAFDTTADGDYDYFVLKLSPDGSRLVYSTYLGGSDEDRSRADGLAVDTAGNAYVTGETRSRNFPTTSGAFASTYTGGLTDAFVTKLNPAGSGLVWSTFLGGGSEDGGFSVSLDDAGNVYTAGQTYTSGGFFLPPFPTTPGAFDRTANGATDVYAAKLNASGAALLWSTFIGGGGDDYFPSLVADPAGGAYVAGYADSGTSFPTTPGSFDPTPNSQPPFLTPDAFVLKLSPTAASLVYSTLLGGSAIDGADGLAVDAAGNAYVTGDTLSQGFPTTSDAADRTLGGEIDGYFAKLNPAGSALLYSTYLGGDSEDRGASVAADRLGNAYVTGVTESANFPATPGAFDTTANGEKDAFVTKIGAPQCSDGADNDGDGQVDFPADPGCSSPGDDDETDPAPTPGCTVLGGGQIVARSGDRATFAVGARVSRAGVPSAGLVYVDHGPTTRLSVFSRDATSVTCSPDGTKATILGRALVAGGTTSYRVEVTDHGGTRSDDLFSLFLDTGYSSGEQQLRAGNILIP
jgi:hypothetical protein